MFASQDGQGIARLRTGFRDLDAILTQVAPPDVVILAARPSIGKSSLALDIARHLAVDEDLPVAIFSLEMSKQEVMTRLLAAQSRVDTWRLRRDELRPDDQTPVALALTAFAAGRLFIEDNPSIQVEGIAEAVRRLIDEETHLSLAVLDYLQLIPGVTSADHGYQRVIHDLKAVAQELSVPILVLAQLSRAVEQRPDHRPRLCDVDGLGADLNWLLFRDEVYNTDSAAKGMVEVAVGGSDLIGECKLQFASECGRFSDL